MEDSSEGGKSAEGPRSGGTAKRFAIFGLIVVLAFLIGFVPMWLKSRQDVQRLQELQQELDVARMQLMLASAIVDARQGGYEPARQSVSSFYTSLSEEAGSSSFSDQQRQEFEAVFSQRDEIITLLARSDPSSVGRLSDLYVLLRDILSGRAIE
jgi:hypothetical protein